MTIRSRRTSEVICNYGIEPSPEDFQLLGRLSVRARDDVSRIAAAYTSVTWSDPAPRSSSRSFDDDTFVIDFDEKDRPIGVEVLSLTDRPGPEFWSFVCQHRGSPKGDMAYLAAQAACLAWLRLDAALESAGGLPSKATQGFDTDSKPAPSWVSTREIASIPYLVAS